MFEIDRYMALFLQFFAVNWGVYWIYFTAATLIIYPYEFNVK